MPFCALPRCSSTVATQNQTPKKCKSRTIRYKKRCHWKRNIRYSKMRLLRQRRFLFNITSSRRNKFSTAGSNHLKSSAKTAANRSCPVWTISTHFNNKLAPYSKSAFPKQLTPRKTKTKYQKYGKQPILPWICTAVARWTISHSMNSPITKIQH